MRRSTSIRMVVILLGGLLAVGTLAYGGLKGKLYMKTTETLLTERTGQVCRTDDQTFCERNFRCPKGQVAYALIYNIKETEGKKQLAGLSLVCSNPNSFTDPQTVGISGAEFAGEVVSDYCPVGYHLIGAEFSTNDRYTISGSRRVCRRYDPRDERPGPNVFGEGFDAMTNACPADHWVTGVKISYDRIPGEGKRLDSNIINARFYCDEMRHYLIEPSESELEEPKR